MSGGHPSETLAIEDRFRDFFAVKFLELWFGVEEVHLRRPSALKQVDDTLGFPW